jgi:hypothetical protein
MAKVLDTVLLLALPASGKSEVRTYLSSLPPQDCLKKFGIGPTLQLDDYPYVHFMHRIDDELFARGFEYVFYKGPERPFINEFEWGTLIELLNDDYDDLTHNRQITVPSAAQYYFDRIDTARSRPGLGLPRVLDEIPYGVRLEIGQAMEEECAAQLKERNETCGAKLKGKTIVIEMARGGANGAAFPLTPPRGYEYALSKLSETILDRSSILYVWVDPAESRRKNLERAKPDGQGSILHHCVPMEVMLGDYGCDDIDHLLKTSGKPGTIKSERVSVVEVKGEKKFVWKTWHLPTGRFDNRKDLTTFVRKERSKWTKKDTDAISKGLAEAFKTLL